MVHHPCENNLLHPPTPTWFDTLQTTSRFHHTQTATAAPPNNRPPRTPRAWTSMWTRWWRRERRRASRGRRRPTRRGAADSQLNPSPLAARAAPPPCFLPCSPAPPPRRLPFPPCPSPPPRHPAPPPRRHLRPACPVCLTAPPQVRGDVNTFGVMMVATGDADGMVSGAIHTTAATIRPAMQVCVCSCARVGRVGGRVGGQARACEDASEQPAPRPFLGLSSQPHMPTSKAQTGRTLGLKPLSKTPRCSRPTAWCHQCSSCACRTACLCTATAQSTSPHPARHD